MLRKIITVLTILTRTDITTSGIWLVMAGE